MSDQCVVVIEMYDVLWRHVYGPFPSAEEAGRFLVAELNKYNNRDCYMGYVAPLEDPE